MAQNRGFYAGVALVGAGAYYFYRAGGDPQTVGEQIRGRFICELWNYYSAP